jgi:hypothetical protein
MDRNRRKMNTDSASGIDILPLNRTGGLVVLADVTHQLAGKVGGRLEDSRAMTWRSSLASQIST